MTLALAQSPGTSSSNIVTVTSPQLSETVGSSVGNASLHSIVTSVGTFVNTGSVVSSIVITCVAELALSQSSVTVQVLVIV